MRIGGFHAVRPLWLARILALAASLVLAASASSDLLHPRLEPWPLLFLVLDLLCIVSMSRRRFRFAAAAWFATTPILRGIDVLGRDEASLLASILGLLVATALLWPRRQARSRTAPLPALPLSWGVLSAALILLVERGFAVFPADGVRSGEFSQQALATALLFGSLALGQLGRLRLLPRLLGALLAIRVTAGELDAGRPEVWLQSAGLLAFVLGFDWLHAAPSSGERFLRTTGFVLVLSLLPVLLVAPQQLLRPAALLVALAHASAFGLALGLAPRVAGMRRRGTRRPGRFGRPRSAAVWLVVGLPVALVFLVMLREKTALPLAAVALLVPLALALRARSIRTLLLVVVVPLTLIAGEPWRGASSALLGGLVFSLMAFLASSPAAGAYYPRRWNPTFRPNLRLGRSLAGASASVVAVATLLVMRDPLARPVLLDGLAAPVPIAGRMFAPATRPSGDAGAAGSPVAIDPLGRGTWIIDEELDEVALVGSDGHVDRVPVGAWPEKLVVDAQGTVYVSCRGAGRVDIIRPDLSLDHVAVGSEPRALALDEASARLYVGLVTEQALVALDTRSLQIEGRRALGIEPRELALTPTGVAVLPGRGSSVRFVATDLASERDVPLYARNRRAWHGQAMVAVGRDLVVVHSAVDTGLAAPVPTGGYGGGAREPVETLVAVLHDGNPVLYSGSLDRARRIPVAEVSGATIRGGYLLLASRGTGELVRCRLRRAWPEDCQAIGHGAGPTGVAVSDGGQARTFLADARTILAANLEDGQTGQVEVGCGRLDPELALGRQLFHQAGDRRISAATLACATCHPDGREDGLVWRLKGTRRQTPMLTTRLEETSPYDWHGSSPTLEANIRQTIERLGGSGLPEAEQHALARFLLEGLRPPVVPPVPEPALVATGERLFHSAEVGCEGCHQSGSAFAGAGPQDVGSLSEGELSEMRSVDVGATAKTAGEFDTPSLRFVGLTAPYFHDGGAATLEEMLERNHDRMGHTEQLSRESRRALAAYLRSL